MSQLARDRLPPGGGKTLLARLSARAFVKVLRVARTAADLAGSDAVLAHHVTEAIGGRLLDPRQTANDASP